MPETVSAIVDGLSLRLTFDTTPRARRDTGRVLDAGLTNSEQHCGQWGRVGHVVHEGPEACSAEVADHEQVREQHHDGYEPPGMAGLRVRADARLRTASPLRLAATVGEFRGQFRNSQRSGRSWAERLS